MAESLMAAGSEFDDDVIASYSDILFEKRLLEGMIKNKDELCLFDFCLTKKVFRGRLYTIKT